MYIKELNTMLTNIHKPSLLLLLCLFGGCPVALSLILPLFKILFNLLCFSI